MKKTLFLFIAVCAILACFGITAAAQETADVLPDGIVGIANCGMIFEYPENSQEGVLAAAQTGIDGVLVDVSLTKDGVPVAIEAESAMRMLGDAQTAAIRDYTLEQLQRMSLRLHVGGQNNPVTACSVPTLEELLQRARDMGFILVPRFDVSILEDVRSVVDGTDAADSTLLFVTGKEKDVQSAVRDYGQRYAMLTQKRGNVIFSVLSHVRHTEGAAAVNLKTANRYGVIYYKWVINSLPNGMRAVADTSDPATCGAREDCAKWWDDLISRGYSVIITDDPAAFVDYKNECAAAYAALRDAYDFAGAHLEALTYKKTLLNDYKKAYDDAMTQAEILLDGHTAAARDMRACTAAIYGAVKEIDLHYEGLLDGTAGLTVTPARIVLCVLAAAAVLAAQIYFYRRRKEKTK